MSYHITQLNRDRVIIIVKCACNVSIIKNVSSTIFTLSSPFLLTLQILKIVLTRLFTQQVKREKSHWEMSKEQREQVVSLFPLRFSPPPKNTVNTFNIKCLANQLPNSLHIVKLYGMVPVATKTNFVNS